MAECTRDPFAIEGVEEKGGDNDVEAVLVMETERVCVQEGSGSFQFFKALLAVQKHRPREFSNRHIGAELSRLGALVTSPGANVEHPLSGA